MKTIAQHYRKIIAMIAQYLTRAKSANLVQLPKAYKDGANCKNCHYWRNTTDMDIGYCWKADVSVFVTKHQVCGEWAADGTISKWDDTLVNLEKDVRDRPPQVDGTEINEHGVIAYKDKSHIARAAKVGMKALPKELKGASCHGCLFSDGGEKWCQHPKVNQPIDQNDKCKYWNHPKAQTLRAEE